MTPPKVRGWLAASSAALVLLVLPIPQQTIERVYSRGAYLVWQPWVTRLSNLAPFALLDVFILALVALVLWRVTRLAKVVRAAPSAALWEGCRRLIRAIGVLGTLFFVMWGFNYRRTPLASDLPHDERPSVDALRDVIAGADAIGARFRPATAGDSLSMASITRRLHDPLNDALVTLRRPPLAVAGRPKVSWTLTPFFTRAGVDGMIDPFALETIVHPDLLPFERPFALAHEWAHLAGVADEAEASAVGWLACMSGPPEFVYSGAVYLIVEAGNTVPPSVWREVSRRLDPGVRADLIALSQRLSRQQPVVQRTAFRVYDSYLRANRVDDGVASYSRALTLILSPPIREAFDRYARAPAGASPAQAPSSGDRPREPR
jgi:hypothetical protein